MSKSATPSGRVSYPKPTTPSPFPYPLVAPPPYIPYRAAPPSSLLPILPSRPSLSPLPSGWRRTTHIIPAAYPRQFAESSGSLYRESKPYQLEPPKIGETREERLARNEGEARECLRGRYDATRAKGDEGGLYMAAERWIRDKGEGQVGEGVMLVVTHANGFTKESWHPTLRRLLESGPMGSTDTFGSSSSSSSSSPSTSDSTTQSVIDEIWLFDDIHHAASIDLNAGRIGPVHGWSDGGRDIVNFLTHVCAGAELVYGDGQILEWKNGSGGKRRRKKVVVLGHSFGGNALVHAAAEAPELFHSLFLVEPMCPPWAPPRSYLHPGDNFAKIWPLVIGATKRRTVWPSLAEAAKVRSTPFYKGWHEEVFQLYLSHGLVPASAEEGDGAVQLSTPGWGEAAVFGESTGMAEAWDRLKELEVPVGFLMAGNSKATQGEENTGRMVWRPKRSWNERIMDGGHLLVQEKPDEVADAIRRFLGMLSSEINSHHADIESSAVKAKL